MKKLSEDRLTVFDSETGLTWQQSGSTVPMTWNVARAYVDGLNYEMFAGAGNWRLPTRSEAFSLLESKWQKNALYIDTIFDHEQIWIWTADKGYVNINYSFCGHNDIGNVNYVRAVHS